MTRISYDIREDDTTLELMQRLSNEDRALLISKLQALGYKGWLQRYFAQSNEIESWMYETQCQQTATLAELAGEDRALLLYGAIWHSQLAHVARHAFQSPHQTAPESLSRRAVRGAIGSTAIYALVMHKIGWPFDEPCPFSGWN